jgi:DNA polymerase-4
VAARLRAAGVLARTVALKVRRADYSTMTRSLTLEAPTDTSHDLYTAARRLLAGVPVPEDGVRLLGIRAEGLVDAAGVAVQALLDEPEGPGRREAEQALDRVRARYGRRALGPGSLVPGAATVRAIGDLS